MSVTTSRPTLSLPSHKRPDVTALQDELTQLKSRLSNSNEELDRLRARAASRPRMPILPKGPFADAVTTASQEAESKGSQHVLVRVVMSNLDDFLAAGGEDLAEDAMEQVGSALSSHIRATDLVGRLGPASFGIMLAYADARGASAKMARLVARIEETFVLPTEPGAQIFLTHHVNTIAPEAVE